MSLPLRTHLHAALRPAPALQRGGRSVSWRWINAAACFAIGSCRRQREDIKIWFEEEADVHPATTVTNGEEEKYDKGAWRQHDGEGWWQTATAGRGGR